MSTSNNSADMLMKSGDTRLLTVTVRDLDKNEIDISTFSAITYSLARSVDDLDNIIITKSLGSGIEKLPFDAVTNPNQSKYTITLLASDTEPLLGNYYHESKVFDATGNETTTFCSDNVEFCKNLP